MEEVINKLEICKYNKIASNSVVFKSNLLEDFLWLHIPKEIQYDFELIQLQEVTEDCIDVPFKYMLIRDNTEPWYKISSKILNHESGLHVYRMQFKQCSIDEDTVSMYFSYIIQDDDPDKSYIYMNKDKEPNHHSYVWLHL